MSTTLERLRELEDVEVAPGARPQGQEGPPAPTRELDRPSTARSPRAPSINSLSLAWLLIAGSLIMFEPAPRDPNAPIPLWGALLATAFLGGLAAAMAGLFVRRSWAPGAFLVAGVAGLGMAVGCLGTAHHSMPYPLLEIVGFGALTVLSWRTMVAGART